MNISSANFRIVLIISILVMVNLLIFDYFIRLDFTADDRYTLSESTRITLKELNEPATITAYFSEDLPPQLQINRNEFRDILIEYRNRSGGKVAYRFINPNESELLEQEAQQAGVSPLLVNTTERDQSKQIRAYMGAVIEIGDSRDIIPVIRPGASPEYELTTAIRQLATQDKPKIAFLQGNGEPTVNEQAQVVQGLSILNEVEAYTITDTSEIPSFYRAIAWINPTDTIPEEHFRKLERYLRRGGGLFIAFNSVEGNLQNRMISQSNQIGIRQWLSQLGINVNEHFVTDAQCGAVTVQQRMGPIVLPTQVQFPYFPLLSNFSEHPVVDGLESLFVPFTSSIALNEPADSSYNLEAIAFTSELSGTSTFPGFIDIEKEWTEEDFQESNLPVAALAEGKLFGEANARLIIIPSGNLAINGQGQNQQQVNEDNANFVINSLDWLGGNSDLLALRTKQITNRPIKELSDGQRSAYKWGNFLAPILLIVLYGLYRYQRNQKKRQRWIQNQW